MEEVISLKKMRIFEFELEDFNGDMRVAFSILHQLYKDALIADPNWHFFYEGNYTILRCGEDFIDATRFQLSHNGVSFKWAPKEWKEPWNLTAEFQDCFGPIFHSFSVIIMELFDRKNLVHGNKQLLENVADRIIHPFLNMATYLKYFEAGAGGGSGSFVKWEAEIMATLTIQRAHIAGMIMGEQRIKRMMEEERRADKETKVDKEGQDKVQ